MGNRIVLPEPTLLFLVRYVLDPDPNKLKIPAYDSLTADTPYEELYNNPALAERLHAALVARRAAFDRLADYHTLFLRKIPKFLIRGKIRAAKAQVEAARAESKKAHDAYEMLRRLSFQSGEGEELILHKTEYEVL